jgi:hypothetical protein
MPHSPEISDLTPEAVYIEAVWESKPVLPVGWIDISDFVQDVKDGSSTIDVSSGYAWQGVREWVVDHHRVFDEARAKGPILIAEFCSSTPLAAQRTRVHEFTRCGDKARVLVRTICANRPVEGSRRIAPELIPISQALAKSTECRSILEAALQKTFYELTPSEKNNLRLLQTTLRQNIAAQLYTYELEIRQGDKESDWKARYRYREHANSFAKMVAELQVSTEPAIEAERQLGLDLTYRSMRAVANSKQVSEFYRSMAINGLSNYQSLVGLTSRKREIGSDAATQYIDWLSHTAAVYVQRNQHIQPLRVISVDIADPDSIILSSDANLPNETKSMNMYPHAIISLINPLEHIQHDIFEDLPVPDDTVTLGISFDGIPYHALSPEHTQQDLDNFADKMVVMISNLYKKIAVGGQIIYFPWSIPENHPTGQRLIGRWLMQTLSRLSGFDSAGFLTPEERTMDWIIEQLSDRLHHSVRTETFHVNTLRSWMRGGDSSVSAVHSSIMHEKTTRKSLVVTKQPKQLVIDRQTGKRKSSFE